MSIEKRNHKMKNVLIVVLLAAILIVVFGGIFTLQQTAPLRGDEMGRDFNPLQSESVQTSPTGRLVLSTGIVLLLVGFGGLGWLLWSGRNKADHKHS